MLPICLMNKNNLEVSCKQNRCGYQNSCKRLPNFVNVAALTISVQSLPLDVKALNIIEVKIFCVL